MTVGLWMWFKSNGSQNVAASCEKCDLTFKSGRMLSLKNSRTSTSELDSGPLHSARRVASPPASDHPGSGVPRAPRRLGGGSRRPASAGAVEYLSRQLETNSWAPRDPRHSRGWPFKDPFPMELCPISRQSLRGTQNMCTDLAVAPVNRVSPVTSVRPTSPISGNKSVSFNSDPYIPEKQHWQTRYPNDILCYNQEVEHILPERKWNLYKDASSDNKHLGKEVIPDQTKWQFHEERESSTPVLQQLSLSNAAPVRSLSSGRQDTSVKENRDYETLIRNMEEVEEREINACLRDEDFITQMDVTDGNDISVRVDTVMLENFEELEQLIQEEDDDVQMALRIQDRQSSVIKGKKTQNDGLDSPKPVYQLYCR